MKKYCAGHVINEPIPGVDVVILEAESKEEAFQAFMANYARYYAANQELFNDLWIDDRFYRMPDGSECYDPETGRPQARESEILAVVTANVRRFFADQASFADLYLEQLKGRRRGDIMDLPLEMMIYMVCQDLKTDPNEDFFVFELEEMTAWNG